MVFKVRPLHVLMAVSLTAGVLSGLVGSSIAAGAIKSSTWVSQSHVTPKLASTPTATTTGRWVTATTFKGSGSDMGKPFTLTGRRLHIRVTGTGDLGYAEVYLMEKGVDIFKEGAIAEVVLTGEGVASAVTDRPKGEYYMYVVSKGSSWRVSIEEYHQ